MQVSLANKSSFSVMFDVHHRLSLLWWPVKNANKGRQLSVRQLLR